MRLNPKPCFLPSLHAAVDMLTPPPADLPVKCKSNCLLNFAPFNKKMVEKTYRSRFLPKEILK